MSVNELPERETQREPEKDGARKRVGQLPEGGREVPLFLRDGSDGWKGNAQDEKDETGE